MIFILEIILRFIIVFFVWLILFPASWIVTTPFILIFSAFQHRPYFYAVADGYRAVTNFWIDLGIHVGPLI